MWYLPAACLLHSATALSYEPPGSLKTYQLIAVRPLPPSLLGQGPVIGHELVQGLALTGHFLNRGLQAVLFDKPLPEARARLIDMLARQSPA